MRVSRIYVSASLEQNQELDLPDKTSHYLLKVLRLKTAARLVLFNGNGYDYQAEIITTGKKSIRVKILQRSEKQPYPKLRIHLGIGLSKGDRIETALQKATELGVSEVTPLLTQYTAVKLKPEQLGKKIQHWHGVIQSACEQSARNYLPRLHEPTELNQWISSQHQSLKLVFSPIADSPMTEFSTSDEVSMLIGPEGGLSEEEIQLACENNFQAVRLGEYVLRTETAPLAAITAAQILWGEFN